MTLEQLNADIDQALNDTESDIVQQMHVICSCFQNLQENMSLMLETSDLKFSDSFPGEGKEKREYFTRVQVFERKRKNVARMQVMIVAALSEFTSNGNSLSSFNPNAVLIKPTSRLPTPEDSRSALRFICAAHALVDDTIERIEAQKSEYLGQLNDSLLKITGRVDTAINCRANRKKESALRRQVYVKRDLLDLRKDVLETLRSIQIHPHLDSQLVEVDSMPLSSPISPTALWKAQGTKLSSSPPSNTKEQHSSATTASTSQPQSEKTATFPPQTTEEHETSKPAPALPQLSNEPGSEGTMYPDTALGRAFVSDTWKMR